MTEFLGRHPKVHASRFDDNTLNIEPLIYWMTERHAVWRRRRAGDPWPWSADPIFNHWGFCNVFRELDRTTTWLRENWREPYADHPNLWFAMALARQINYIPTLRDIAFPKKWDPKRAYNIMTARRMAGKKVYTGAYTLPGCHGTEKPWSTVYYFLEPLHANMAVLGREVGHSIELTTAMLARQQGFGSFLAYEVATDLRHTRYLRRAPDIDRWANVGPGARRGLNRLYRRPVKFAQPERKFLWEMVDLLGRVREALPSDFPPVELRDIEHSLCETDKYLRVKEGSGTPRSRYRHDTVREVPNPPEGIIW